MNNYERSLIDARDSKAKFETIRFSLDEALTMSESASNVFSKPHRGVWISNISSSEVEAFVKFNSRFDTGSALRIKYNMVINHEKPVFDCLITAPAQKDEWIELTFSFEDRIDIGNVEQQVTGQVSLTNDVLNAIGTQETIDIMGSTYNKQYLRDNNYFHIKEAAYKYVPVGSEFLTLDLLSPQVIMGTTLDEAIQARNALDRPFEIVLHTLAYQITAGEWNSKALPFVVATFETDGGLPPIDNYSIKDIDNGVNHISLQQKAIVDASKNYVVCNFDSFELSKIPNAGYNYDPAKPNFRKTFLTGFNHSFITWGVSQDLVFHVEYLAQIVDL
ncbi:hypothetical protein ABMA75_03165 [Halobacteriovorax sp. ZH4_bin.1]|uniref:hypothetical protein n=1 Tax=unclassified Halobacteriovorax TaxID=2639665 RepID=UPI0037225611